MGLSCIQSLYKTPYELGDKNSKRLAVIDLGIKKNILDNFVKRDLYIKVFHLTQILMKC